MTIDSNRPTEEQAPADAAEISAEPAEQTIGEQAPEDIVDQDLEQLRSSLQEAEQQKGEHHDAMLRMQAEMENLRKRLIRDLERSRRRALEDFMNDLLPVRDSLLRGLEAATDDSATVESLREGKALILKMLAKAMEDHGLEEIDPVGEAFDPERHEAISMFPSPDHPRDTVIEVVQKGYQLHERLIRPARVVVSSGSA